MPLDLGGFAFQARVRAFPLAADHRQLQRIVTSHNRLQLVFDVDPCKQLLHMFARTACKYLVHDGPHNRDTEILFSAQVFVVHPVRYEGVY